MKRTSRESSKGSFQSLVLYKPERHKTFRPSMHFCLLLITEIYMVHNVISTSSIVLKGLTPKLICTYKYCRTSFMQK